MKIKSTFFVRNFLTRFEKKFPTSNRKLSRFENVFNLDECWFMLVVRCKGFINLLINYNIIIKIIFYVGQIKM
jgi:hypothetical protein